VRVSLDGRKHRKVQLDPLDKETMEDRLDAIMHCYHSLTTHRIHLSFSKPSVFQQKIIANRKEKQ